jgi:hypothetical protein
VRNTLAIYITVSLIATVALAQLLYWRLVITRENRVADEPIDGFDMDWLYESVEAWVGLEADDAQPVPVDDPVLVSA